MYKRLVLVMFVILISSQSFPKESKYPEVKREGVVISVNGVINPAAAEYVSGAIRKAAGSRAEVLIIELDTPGGLDTSMRSIVKEIVASPVPVVVFVFPGGARAASAGVFITMAAHVAAMSPGTNIGAAHPVSATGKMDKVMAEKATNDAAAYLKSIAEQRGRNVQWAEEAVRNSVSITEQEALHENVIDLVAADMNSLLSALNGREVKTAYGQRKFNTAGIMLIRYKPGLRYRILDLISDPNVAYILMLLGFYGLLFELTSPGAVLPGVIGSICLVLAFYAFQTLPVNYAGLLLIIIGLVLFVLEIKVASYGMLTVGGLAAVILGSLMLFESPMPFFKLSLAMILPAALITCIFFGVTLRLAYKAHKRRPVTGAEGLVGLEGVAKTDIDREGGTVFVHGESWTAYSDGGVVKGEKVVVEDVKGLRIKVRRLW